jgi:hypothetical protein
MTSWTDLFRAAWANRRHRIDNALPQQMLRQRPAGRLAALE